MRKWMLVLWVALFVLPVCQGTFAASKKKKTTPEKKEANSISAYDKLLKKPGAVTAKSDFITLHKVEGKVYFEIPIKHFGREMLLASTLTTVSNSLFGDIGYKAQQPMHVRFVKGDSAVYLSRISTNATADPNTSQEKALEKSFGDAIYARYKIEAYNPDKTAILVDMTDLFVSDVKEFSFLPNMGFINVKGEFRKEASGLDDIKSFEDNLSVKSFITYKVSLDVLGFIKLADNLPLTGKVTRSLLLLPEKKMKPRLADARVGVFNTSKMHISNKEDGIQRYSLAHRWRLEPKDPAAYERGVLVEPVKPILWYVDDTFPEEWKTPIRKAILSWNAAFEKIGFKNVMQVRDFPKDDPEFDPDNIKYTCIRYLPSTTANAMGPSWVDPTTGEIVNATVLIYNDVIRMVNNWRFVQTAQIDPRVRAKKLPKDVMEESITYVVAHEIGHTLGFLHNMAASASLPVDSLRSATFTQEYGTTSTIMDYARFNYVAQPEDKGVKLSPPTLGIYDYFLIKWNYQPIPQAKNEWEEQAITEQWIDEKVGDPRYRYGRQQLSARYDPSSIEEDLGDDPVKAGTYGVKNLKYILSNLEQWVDNDADYAQREVLYNSISNQYYRYILNVSMNVGGIYLTEVKEGTSGERNVSVPRDVQKASLAWILNEYRNSDWLRTPLTQKFALGVDMTTVLRGKLAGTLKKLVENVTLSSSIASNPYKIDEFLTDLYNGAFQSAMKGTKLTDGDKILQGSILDMLLTPLAEEKKSGGLFGLTNAYAPNLDEILAYNLDESGIIRLYEEQFRQIEAEQGDGFIASQMKLNDFRSGVGYGFQRKVDTKAIDNSVPYLIDIAYKAQKLIVSKAATSTGDDKIHYQALLAKINKTIKK